MKEAIIQYNDATDAYGNHMVISLKKLIRCKDCKQSGIDSTSYPQYWCSAHSEYHKPDWFCADGEKAVK